MKERLILFCKYYVFWILFFWVQKPIFMLTQTSRLEGVSFADWFRVMGHAFQLDLSVASYITAGFGLMMVVSIFVSDRRIRPIANGYTWFLLVVAILIFIGDIGTFPSWGYHIDKTIFMYLATPKEMLACAEWWVWVLGLLAWIIIPYIIYKVYKRLIAVEYPPIRPVGKQVGLSVAMLLISGLLFLPIRGSFGVSTMNTGRVYFSSNQMLNVAAVNPVFNLIESFEFVDFNTERYRYMSCEEAEEALAPLLTQANSEGHYPVLKTDRPDIIVLIVESLSANVIEPLEGTTGVTPNLNRYCEEGILFTHAYASSYRTDRGVVAVMSGFPGQPTSSLMVVPSKCHNLPFWSRQLQEVGYRLKFYYGGDEDFTSMRSYLIDAGFNDRVSQTSFPMNMRLSKWGVPDAPLLDYAAQYITAHETGQPTLDVILTLSSHEPFDVPVHRFSNPYLNGIAYTDSCIGAFVESIRSSERWNNTLIVITGDHGFPYPAYATRDMPERYRLPILMLGGAIQEPMRIESVCSQIDIAPTILAQLGLTIEGFKFGKDLFNSATNPFAFYSFNDGFGLVDTTGITVIDRKVDEVVYNRPDIGEQGPTAQDSLRERQARAFVQSIYEEIEKL